MLLAFLALISLLPSVSLTEPPRILPRATGSVGPTRGNPTYQCWEHSDSRTGHLDTTSRSDCAKALKRIIKSDKAQAPMIFSHLPDVGYHVPDQIESGTCTVHIDVTKDSNGKEVVMPMEAVAAAALHIMENCLNDQPHWTGLGGHAISLSRSGSGGALDVVIFGQPPPALPTLRMPFLYSSDPSTS